ncbi:uncharacterized protein PRCAT00004577001 [Priceomyces carsonii]|uniref:uncharacterized protein n=1 Tax=Priceomyces carsonii TaxID=28549 RepID=UPI002ED88410|nr:unnamed protein product [Priceomyces carsonii]
MISEEDEYSKVNKDAPTESEIFNEGINILKLPVFTRYKLSFYNGKDKPEIFVAIRGYVYDVTSNKKSYGPGKSYHRLAGKDSSRLLGLNTLRLELTKVDSFPEQRTWYCDDFNDKQNATLDKWVAFFRKRYRIVGIVGDHDPLSLS